MKHYFNEGISFGSYGGATSVLKCLLCVALMLRHIMGLGVGQSEHYRVIVMTEQYAIVHLNSGLYLD